MKKKLNGRAGFTVLCFFLLASCISMQGREMTMEENTVTRVLGSVTTQWVRYNFLNIPPSDLRLEGKTVSKLKEEAQRQGYKGNIEIKNITAEGKFNGLTLIQIIPLFAVLGNIQTVVASGDVVVPLADAVAKTSAELAVNLPGNSTIAVLSIFSDNNGTSEYIIGELEYNLSNSGNFVIVERRRLDQIRNEQNFQMSGEVSDDSAVSIGNMLGANIVIIGEMTGTGLNQLLTIRAIDVTSAQIIAIVRE